MKASDRPRANSRVSNGQPQQIPKIPKALAQRALKKLMTQTGIEGGLDLKFIDDSNYFPQRGRRMIDNHPDSSPEASPAASPEATPAAGQSVYNVELRREKGKGFVL